jgi:hypothetical protein
MHVSGASHVNFLSFFFLELLHPVHSFKCEPSHYLVMLGRIDLFIIKYLTNNGVYHKDIYCLLVCS